MQQIRKRNMPPIGPVDITSFVVLFLCAAIFFYVAFYRNAGWNTRHIQSLTEGIETELKKIKRPVKTKPDKTARPKVSTHISDVPEFLEKLDRELASSGLELDNINKSEHNDYTYEFVAYAPFNRLVNFLFSTEKSNLAIQGIGIHPYSSTKQLIRVNLRLLGDKMTAGELKDFRNFQEKFPEKLRDPFRKGKVVRISDRAQPRPPSIINLTWKYKLTGIGFDKVRYATIDHNNYYVNQDFHGMKIVAIKSNRVDLVSGSRKFFITFRYKSKTAGK